MKILKIEFLTCFLLGMSVSKFYCFTLLFLYIFQSIAIANPSKDNSLKYLINALIEINHPKAFRVASDLEKIRTDIKTYNLIIRKADLDFNDLKKIAEAIKQVQKSKGPDLITLSMSFNKNIKDKGLNLILNVIPHTTKILAFVECGLTDTGALKIIEYAYKNKNLNQIYLEGNFFSQSIQNKFNKLKIDRPQLTIISQWPSETFKEIVRKNYN